MPHDEEWGCVGCLLELSILLSTIWMISIVIRHL